MFFVSIFGKWSLSMGSSHRHAMKRGCDAEKTDCAASCVFCFFLFFFVDQGLSPTPNCIILEKTEFYPFDWQPTH